MTLSEFYVSRLVSEDEIRTAIAEHFQVPADAILTQKGGIKFPENVNGLSIICAVIPPFDYTIVARMCESLKVSALISYDGGIKMGHFVLVKGIGNFQLVTLDPLLLDADEDHQAKIIEYEELLDL